LDLLAVPMDDIAAMWPSSSVAMTSRLDLDIADATATAAAGTATVDAAAALSVAAIGAVTGSEQWSSVGDRANGRAEVVVGTR
jgi:hypothetical protein